MFARNLLHPNRKKCERFTFLNYTHDKREKEHIQGKIYTERANSFIQRHSLTCFCLLKYPLCKCNVRLTLTGNWQLPQHIMSCLTVYKSSINTVKSEKETWDENSSVREIEREKEKQTQLTVHVLSLVVFHSIHQTTHCQRLPKCI